MSNLQNQLSLLVATFGLAASSAAVFGQTQQVQTDFTSDPGWDAVNNRTEPQDFGFSNTTHLAGEAPGEIGGFIVRSDSPNAFYGFDVGELTLDDPISFSGKFNLVELTSFSGGTPVRPSGKGSVFGFYNSTVPGDAGDSRPLEALGWRWDDESLLAYVKGPDGSPRIDDFANFVIPQITTAAGEETDIGIEAATHTFSVVYDPTGNSGTGTLSLTLDGDVQSFDLDPTARDIGATFDRFGIKSTRSDGGVMELYYDDLTFTSENAIPEPASLGLFSVASILLTRRRRR